MRLPAPLPAMKRKKNRRPEAQTDTGTAPKCAAFRKFVRPIWASVHAKAWLLWKSGTPNEMKCLTLFYLLLTSIVLFNKMFSKTWLCETNPEAGKSSLRLICVQVERQKEKREQQHRKKKLLISDVKRSLPSKKSSTGLPCRTHKGREERGIKSRAPVTSLIQCAITKSPLGRSTWWLRREIVLMSTLWTLRCGD